MAHENAKKADAEAKNYNDAVQDSIRAEDARKKKEKDLKAAERLEVQKAMENSRMFAGLIPPNRSASGSSHRTQGSVAPRRGRRSVTASRAPLRRREARQERLGLGQRPGRARGRQLAAEEGEAQQPEGDEQQPVDDQE